MNSYLVWLRMHRIAPNEKRNVPIATPQNIRNVILDLLQKFEALTPSQLAEHCGVSREHMQRHYLTELIEQGKVRKVEGTHNYALINSTIEEQQILEGRRLISNEEFYACKRIQKWKELNKAKHRDDAIIRFCCMCMGQIEILKHGKFIKVNIDFHMNPDFWIHPATTKECVQALRKAYGISDTDRRELPRDVRNAISHFLIYGMELKGQLTQEVRDALGLSGAKNKPKASHIEMTLAQYEQSKTEFDKFSRKMLAMFGFDFWVGGRPSTRYIMRCEDLEFFDREVRYVEINEQRVTDSKFIELLKVVKPELEIKTYKHRAMHLRQHEFKTDDDFPKFMLDGDMSVLLEAYVKQRMNQGFKYLFWDNNETEFTFENYDSIVQYTVHKHDKIYKEVFARIGLNYEYSKKRSNYAMRHFSIQQWMNLTDYDIAFVGHMFHKNIDTLLTWYAGITKTRAMKKLGEIIF